MHNLRCVRPPHGINRLGKTGGALLGEGTAYVVAFPGLAGEIGAADSPFNTNLSHGLGLLHSSCSRRSWRDAQIRHVRRTVPALLP